MIMLLGNVTFYTCCIFVFNYLHLYVGMYFAEICGHIKRANTWSNSARLNTIVIIELLAVYISPFWFMHFIMLLAYLYATFNAERELHISFCSLWVKSLSYLPKLPLQEQCLNWMFRSKIDDKNDSHLCPRISLKVFYAHNTKL